MKTLIVQISAGIMIREHGKQPPFVMIVIGIKIQKQTQTQTQKKKQKRSLCPYIHFVKSVPML